MYFESSKRARNSYAISFLYGGSGGARILDLCRMHAAYNDKQKLRDVICQISLSAGKLLDAK